MYKIRWLSAVLSLILISACSRTIQTTRPDDVASDRSCPYRLPWPNSVSNITVSQGYYEADNLSHQPTWGMEYAVDFSLPEGTPVVATRAGRVSEVHDGETEYGGPKMANKANFVIIDHSGGVFSLYFHLRAGLEVKRGDVVQQGQLIGYSGKTGWTYGGAHLHYQLQERGDRFAQSIPLCFQEMGTEYPVVGREYTSQNSVIMLQGMQVTRSPEVGVPILPGELSFVVNRGELGYAIDLIGPDRERETVLSIDSLSGFDWSPNGKEIVYAIRSLTDPTYSTIRVFQLESGSSRELVPMKKVPFGLTPSYYSYSQPIWAHNGRYIYFLTGDGRVVGDTISRVEVTTGAIQEVIAPLGSLDFDLSPAGLIVFRQWMQGGHAIFSANSEGLAVTPVIDRKEEQDFCCVSWSPDSQYIAFSAPDNLSFSGQAYDIWVVKPNGTGLRRLTDDPNFRDLTPAWSPDGNWIAFSRSRTGEGESDIWMIPVGGGEPINLTKTPDVSEILPVWRPSKLESAPNPLVGIWEGRVRGVSESQGSYSENRRIEILTECDFGSPCIVFPPYTDLDGPYPLLTSVEGMYCFGDSFVHSFCFNIIDEDTVFYEGQGGLWGEEGNLHRLHALSGLWSGTVSQPSDTEYNREFTTTIDVEISSAGCESRLCLTIPTWGKQVYPSTSVEESSACFSQDLGELCFALLASGGLELHSSGPDGTSGTLQRIE